MALSKPVISDTVDDIPVTAQHYLVCGTQDCANNCLFYCNPCHQPMCKQCRDEHQRSPGTKNHEMVPYRQRKQKLPVEKCDNHPTKNIDMFCRNCQVPLCSRCAIQYHQGHIFDDLETIYSEKFNIFLDKIHVINQYLLPTSQGLKTNIKEDAKELKSFIDGIKLSLKAEAESIKCLVDSVMSQRIELVNEMEDNIQKDLDKQEKTYEDYTIYLENLVEKFHRYMSTTNIKANPVIFLLSEHLKIKPIPDTSKPVYPVFTAGQCKNADVAKLLGKTTFPDTKPEQRKIKPMETASTTLKSTEKQKKQAKRKSDVKQTVPFSSYVTKIREYTIPDFDSVYHLSLGKSGRLWVSDDKGRLVKTDGQGNLLQKIQTSGKDSGYHTVTLNGDLIYLDTDNKVLFKIAINNAITKFVETGAWLPLCLCSSHISEDIFVGMIKGGESKVTRYNKTGKKIQNIQRDNKGQGLYSNPRYITENINGDICVSDLRKKAVVVVKKSGQYRFSYKGQGAVLYPFGLCTDNSGNIVVCDSMKNTIHLLDQDGQFIFQLLTGQHEVKLPRSVCVDDENNIYVGQYNTNALKVYMYLQ